MSTQWQGTGHDDRPDDRHDDRHDDRGAAPARRPLPAPSGPSTATVVWGLVLLSLAALAGLTELTGWDVDPTLALPAVLLGAGALLVVAAVVAVVRRPRRQPEPADAEDGEDPLV